MEGHDHVVALIFKVRQRPSVRDDESAELPVASVEDQGLVAVADLCGAPDGARSDVPVYDVNAAPRQGRVEACHV